MGYYTINAQYRPAILPFYRNEIGYAAYGAIIPKKIRIPPKRSPGIINYWSVAPD